MSDYWIQDAEGGVLGPVSLEVLRDILGTGQLGQVASCSRDGAMWKPVASFTEIADLVRPRAATDQARRDQAAAQVIRENLARWRDLSPNDLFGVRPGETDANV